MDYLWAYFAARILGLMDVIYQITGQERTRRLIIRGTVLVLVVLTISFLWNVWGITHSDEDDTLSRPGIER